MTTRDWLFVARMACLAAWLALKIIDWKVHS